MLNDATGKTYISFYKAFPAAGNEEQQFFAASAQCQWKNGETGEKIPIECTPKYLDEAARKSFIDRITKLLDLKWEEDGYLAAKLFRLIRFCKSKGILIDCEKLLLDLKNWNNDNHYVQRKWARACIGTDNLDKKGEEKDAD